MDIGGSFEASLNQSQQLAITQTMVQSLRILCMPVTELSQFLREYICENPVLDMEALAEADTPPEPDTSAREKPRAEDEENRFDVDYQDIWRVGATGMQEMPEIAAGEGLFADMLAEQVNTTHLEENFRMLCHYIIGCLNPRGYLDIQLEDIAEETGYSLFEMTQALYYVQSLYPAGVGARNLKECLLLQLAQGDDFNPNTVGLVTAGLTLVAGNNLAAIQKLLQCDRAEAEHSVRVVRGLNPIPSQGYYTGEAMGTVTPDVVVRCGEEGLTVTMNERYLPRIRILNDYKSMTAGDGEAKRYIDQKIKEAKVLQSAVEEREKTLTAVMRVIVQKQAGYFEKGESLQPMTQAEIGQELEVHTSTVSRAVQGKYLKGPMGTVELKKLFSGAVKTAAGGVVSADMAKRKLQELIQDENPGKPLSDENLRAVLAAMDIDIARRTVAKYREELGIQPASRRKR